jgi:FtsP/CotA-like multicopper oxidase with cupredoxin domain
MHDAQLTALPAVHPPSLVDLRHEDIFALGISAVRKRIGEAEVPMLAFNQSIPGPTLRVHQSTELTVRVTNDVDMQTTVHWHGLRLENRFDGVPYDTQEPIGEVQSFTYRLRFPDPGVYWYHPHMREDYAQEMGLYGAIVVVPGEADYWPPVNRELVLMVDDILMAGGQIAPFGHDNMGRFGNVMLINGETTWTTEVRSGEVVRLQLTNVANVRNFRLGIPKARMKLAGGDIGRCEHEQFVEHVLISPGERVILDTLFPEAGRYPIELRSSQGNRPLGHVVVNDKPAEPSFADEFESLRTNPELAALRAGLMTHLERPPDKTITLVGEMPGMAGHAPAMTHAGMDHETMHEAMHGAGMGNVLWKLVDSQTGAVNHEIRWSFAVGERVKVRLVNDAAADHPMSHPFHVHGERFLVLSRNGVVNPNLVWKDTVLVDTGDTVDLLIDMTNPGLWMAHCHIAEHAEAGMMFDFQVV